MILLTFIFILSYLAMQGLSCGMRDLVPPPWMKPGPLNWECGVLFDKEPSPLWGQHLKDTSRSCHREEDKCLIHCCVKKLGYISIQVVIRSCFIIIIYLFIWLCWILIPAHSIFSCGIWNLVPWPGIEPGPPTFGTQSLSHWTTREVPVVISIKKKKKGHGKNN